MTTLFNDIKYAFRIMRKNPGFALTVVLVLGLGIGANTALFSVIHGVLLDPLPFPQPERLVWLRTHFIKSGGEGSVAAPDYRDWAAQNTVFEDMTAIHTSGFNLTGQGDPITLKTWCVSSNFFDTFGAPPLLGRGFSSSQTDNNEGQAVILSHSLWVSLFASDSAIVGKTLTLDGGVFTVIGVARPEMDVVTNAAQIFVFLPADVMNRPRWDHFLAVVGRLKENVTLDQAQSEMALISQRLARQYPDDNKDKGVKLTSLHTYLVRDYSASLWVLYGAVTFLLLLACVNVANLMLVKAGTRIKEITIKQALGAGRLRLVRQLLTESAVMALGACLLGWCCAYWIMEGLKIIAPQIITHSSTLPGFAKIELNAVVCGFTILISALTALGVGLTPAWHAAQTKTYQVLKTATRSASHHLSRHRILQTLVAGEISLALILLMGAGLLIQSLLRLQHTHPGFQPDGVLAVHMKLPDTQAYNQQRKRTAFYMEAAQRLEKLPGVQCVGVINHIPLNPPSSDQGFTLDGDSTGQMHGAYYRQISPDYFKTMGISLVRGRYFSLSDVEKNNNIMIVNQDFVDKYLPDTEPIGQRILHWDTPKEIVGVVGNVKFERLHTRESLPAMYEPIDQGCWRAMTLVVRSSGHPLALVSAVRKEIQAMAPNQPILRFDSMDQVLGNSMALDRFSTFLLVCMAGVALLLALIGIFGVIAHYVNERTHEIGIRLALGADVRDILFLVLRKGLVLTCVGIVIGLLGTVGLSRFMSGLLYDVKPTDPLTFVLVPAVLIVVALCACAIPARRAARTDPMEALRYE